jgi:hypothetical protein
MPIKKGMPCRPTRGDRGFTAPRFDAFMNALQSGDESGI